MRPLWLALLSFCTITLIVFVFFVLRLLPVKTPALSTQSDLPAQTQPTITFVDPAQGPTDAKVVIVEYADFQCQACKTLDDSLAVVLRTFPNDVRHVWKDMPNESAHPLATLSAIAARCAGQQGKFWEYHDALYERQSYLAEDQFAQIANDLALDTSAFQRCYDSRDTLPLVKKDFDEGRALGIVSTPTLYLNGTSYVGAVDAEQLVSLVRQALSASASQTAP